MPGVSTVGAEAISIVVAIASEKVGRLDLDRSLVGMLSQSEKCRLETKAPGESETGSRSRSEGEGQRG